VPVDIVSVPAIPFGDPVNCCAGGIAAERVVTTGVCSDKTKFTGVKAECLGTKLFADTTVHH
jgi:hypothetical protein